MALFAVIFEDDPARFEVRQREMKAHLQFLDRERAQILSGGSLREGEEARPVGGLWLVEAQDRAAVEAIYMRDPFWLAGLRKSVRVREWRKAFPERKIPI